VLLGDEGHGKKRATYQEYLTPRVTMRAVQ
jgi:hypothetical protein